MSENLTRNGVAYDLKLSPYKLLLNYKNNDLEYVFSSQLNKDRFLNSIKPNRDKINTSLTKRFNIDINADLLCDIKLYSTIEKRGFLIKTNDKEIECLNIIRLDGNNLILMN